MFNHSSSFKEKLNNIQKTNNKPIAAIVQQVPTRWNSIYLMVDSVLANRDSLEICLSGNIDQAGFKLADHEADILSVAMRCLKVFDF